jgi:GxxExxY protein
MTGHVAGVGRAPRLPVGQNEGNPMTTEQQRLNQISQTVIGLSYKVANALGRGFLECVYENALAQELTKQRLHVKQQDRLIAKYDDVIVGDFRVDLVVDDQLLVEIKAVGELSKTHEGQLYNYLKASNLKLGLLINFGAQSVQISRRVNGF